MPMPTIREVCLLTGQPFLRPVTSRRLFISPEAADIASALSRIDSALYKVAMEYGFTKPAEEAVRGHLWDLANTLNVTRRLRKRAHVEAPIDPVAEALHRADWMERRAAALARRAAGLRREAAALRTAVKRGR